MWAIASRQGNPPGTPLLPYRPDDCCPYCGGVVFYVDHQVSPRPGIVPGQIRIGGPGVPAVLHPCGHVVATVLKPGVRPLTRPRFAHGRALRDVPLESLPPPG